MSSRNDGAFVAFFGEIADLPWWVGVALAPLSYLGLHWVSRWPVPTTLSGTNMLKVFAIPLAGVFQYVVPVAFVIAALVSVVRRRKRARLLAGVAASDAVGSLNEMSWHEFEMLEGEAFRRQGYSVTETPMGADGGVDLILRKERETYLVQCKQWRSASVGVPKVRELYGAMAAQGATGGFFVTSGQYTKPAVEFAQGRNLTLIAGPELHAMIRGVGRPAAAAPPLATAQAEPVPSATPTCPACGAGMVLRTARRGERAGQDFWGCVTYPACRGIRAAEVSTRP